MFSSLLDICNCVRVQPVLLSVAHEGGSDSYTISLYYGFGTLF